MAYFHTTVLDNQIKALPTTDTASGSVASFDTDITENLVKCVCEVASGSDIVSVFVNSINIWNEEIEVGTLDNSTGETAIDNNKMRSVSFIPVKPNTTYGVYNSTGVNLYIYSYGVDKSFIDFDNTGMVTGSTFTTGASTYYIKFRTQNNPAYNNNISINNDESTTYHAFSGIIVNLGETLSGNGSLDVLSGILTRSDNTTKQLSANYIQTKNGINNIWCDTNGDTEVKFLLSVGKKIQ